MGGGGGVANTSGSSREVRIDSDGWREGEGGPLRGGKVS